MGSVEARVPSSAPPTGGPGVPGGTSAPLVGFTGRRPNPEDGASAPGYLHPDLGVPPSLGTVGIQTGVSSLDMGGLRVSLSMGLSQSGVGGTGVPGGASILHGGNIGCRPGPDEGVPSPARSYHASGPCPLASLRSLCGSPVPSLVVVSAFHPSCRGASLPSSVSFLVIPGIIQVRVLLLAVIKGGAPPLRLPVHGVAVLAVRLHQFTPFLPRYVIGVLRVRSGMSPIGRSQHWMTSPFLRSRFLQKNLLCHPSSRAQII